MAELKGGEQKYMGDQVKVLDPKDLVAPQQQRPQGSGTPVTYEPQQLPQNGQEKAVSPIKASPGCMGWCVSMFERICTLRISGSNHHTTHSLRLGEPGAKLRCSPRYPSDCTQGGRT